MLFGKDAPCPATWYPHPETNITSAAVAAKLTRALFMAASPPASPRSRRAIEYYPRLPRSTTHPAAKRLPPALQAAPLSLLLRSRCSAQARRPRESRIPHPRRPQPALQTSCLPRALRARQTRYRKLPARESLASPAEPISLPRRLSSLPAGAP